MSRPVAFAVLALVACGGSSESADPDAPAPDDGEPAAVCGTRAGMTGLTEREVVIDGRRRTYLVYLPEAPRDPTPLVIVFHGYTMSGAKMHEITDYAALADAQGIAVAFPDGQGGPDSTGAPWNVGTGTCPSTLGPPPVAAGDDFALIDHIKADIDKDRCIDREHVFVTGFSMGGYFSHHAGCMRSDLAAVAPHSGGTHALDDCPVARKPIIIFHGLADALIPPGCNDPEAPAVGGITPAADAWAAHNGCSLTTTSRPVQGGTCHRYENCPDGGQVEMCSFDGMAHCWAGGAASAGIYACPNAASATTLTWEFVEQFAW